MTSNFIPEFLRDISSKVEKKNRLISLVENSDDIEGLITAIKVIAQCEIETREIYEIIENLAISHESPLVRSEGVRILIENFIEDSVHALKYLINTEKSPLVIKKFRNELKLRNCQISNSLYDEFIGKYSKYYSVIPEETEFLIDLECLKEIYKINPFNLQIENHHIIRLDLVGWNLKFIPDSIKNLHYLKYFNLWNNNLSNLPKSFENLSNLEELYLDWNNFKKIPDIDWSKLKSLKRLSLTNNPDLKVEFTSFNPQLMNNFLKKYLQEGVNKLDISALISLEILTGQKIIKLENENKINKLYACNYIINDAGYITGIYLYGYYGFQIRRIPEEVFSLISLRNLVIRYQQIEKISECVKYLCSLEKLDLMGNKLKYLPTSFNQLKSLKYLDIEGNLINYIPDYLINSETELWI